MDEVLELRRVAHEEHRRVVADKVVVPLVGVELQREAARVAHGVREALLTGNRGDARKHGRTLPDLCEEARLRELRDVLGDLEEAVGAGPLGMHDPLRDALAVEVLHLLDDVVIVQHRRPAGADGQRVLVACGGDPGVGGRRRRAVLAARG